jgi:hypothetical protein
VLAGVETLLFERACYMRTCENKLRLQSLKKSSSDLPIVPPKPVRRSVDIQAGSTVKFYLGNLRVSASFGRRAMIPAAELERFVNALGTYEIRNIGRRAHKPKTQALETPAVAQ